MKNENRANDNQQDATEIQEYFHYFISTTIDPYFILLFFIEKYICGIKK